MRISHGMLAGAAARTLDGLRQRLAQAQDQVASGETLRRPSDDPYRTASVMEWQALQQRLDRAETAAVEGRDWLAAAEDGLNRLLAALQQSRDLSVTARSSVPPAAREALAQEIDRMRDEALAAANTRYRDVYIFAGNRVAAPPFAANGGGVAYSGDAGAAAVEVLPGLRLNLRVAGDRLVSGGDFIRILNDLSSAVRQGSDSAIAEHQGELDTAIDAIVRERSDVGVRGRTLADYEQVARDLRLNVVQQMSETAGADLAQAALTLAQEETAYRAALGVAARSLPPSLMEMLR